MITSGIYHVSWRQSDQYPLSAVVVADDEHEAIKAVGFMFRATAIAALRLGDADPSLRIEPGTVIAQEQV